MITDQDIQKLAKVFATKDDLKRFATKEDIQKLPTRDDVESMIETATERIVNEVREVIDMIGDHEERIRLLERPHQI